MSFFIWFCLFVCKEWANKTAPFRLYSHLRTKSTRRSLKERKCSLFSRALLYGRLVKESKIISLRANLTTRCTQICCALALQLRVLISKFCIHFSARLRNVFEKVPYKKVGDDAHIVPC